jgi:hypothetical protein
MSFLLNKGVKVRGLQEIIEGAVYVVSSPTHQDVLIKVVKQEAGTISALALDKTNDEKTFNWNNDFVLGKEEIYKA